MKDTVQDAFQGLTPTRRVYAVRTKRELLGASMLFGVRERDHGTPAAVCVFLVLTALVISTIPALRATKVQPLATLSQ